MSFNNGGSGEGKKKIGTIRLGDLRIGSGTNNVSFRKMASADRSRGFGESFNSSGLQNSTVGNNSQNGVGFTAPKKQFGNFNVSAFLTKNSETKRAQEDNENNRSGSSRPDNNTTGTNRANTIAGPSQQQFRKVNFNFSNTTVRDLPRSQQQENNDREMSGSRERSFNKPEFQKNFSKQNNRSYGAAPNRNNSNGSFGNKFNRQQSKGGFTFKSNKVNVKRSTNQKKEYDDNTRVFKRTSHAGSSVDKYSINGILKTMSNNIQLDTEIDEVLGNVISVKLSGISTSNSLQKEKKVRTAARDSASNTRYSKPIVRDIFIQNDRITLAELAKQMALSSKELSKILRSEGVEVDYNNDETIIDGDTAELVASSCGHRVKRSYDNECEKKFLSSAEGTRNDLKTRNPIVVIMGHVDHGKTTLLDTIRKTSVADGEAGGITQHIGAYIAKVGDRSITFLDTPGHSAFTEMRARGARITDIAVIVVSADDGIMPQTIEAISHAKSAGVPIIVAINKIDKPEANIERTQNMLLQHEVIPEQLGGDVIVVPISAKNNINIDKLLSAVILQADVLDLKAYWSGRAEGTIIESKIDKKKGVLASVIVENGVLRQGDFVVAGCSYGKVRMMFDENGNALKEAYPSMPVEILGLNVVPDAGDKMYAVENEKDAKEFIEYKQGKSKEENNKAFVKASAADVLSRIRAGNKQNEDVSIIVRADTKGSLEAIIGSLSAIKNGDVGVNVLQSGVGCVVENDVLLAQASNAYIVAFNVQKCDKKVLDLAEKCGVSIRDYKIIYEMFNDIENIISGKLEPVVKTIVNGTSEVKAVFEISKVGKIYGCAVRSGTLEIGSKVNVVRGGEKILETSCTSLKCGKENVKEVQSGKECGIGLDGADDVHVGDILEFFCTKEEKLI